MAKRIKKANKLCFTLIIEGTISMDAPRYIRWFVEESSVTFKDGKPITCYKLSYELNDDIFDEWALHIRRHYESDDELAESISATEMDIEDYLRKYVIPQKRIHLVRLPDLMILQKLWSLTCCNLYMAIPFRVVSKTIDLEKLIANMGQIS